MARDYWAETWAECQKRNSGFYDHEPIRFYDNGIRHDNGIRKHDDGDLPECLFDLDFEDDGIII